MKRPIFVLLVSLSIAASGASVYLYRENLFLRQQLAALTPDTLVGQGEDAAVAPEAATQASDSPDTAVVVAENPAGRQTRPVSDRREDWRSRRNEGFSRFMSDPGMREVMLSRIKGRVDEEYNALFVRLGLDEEQTEALRTFIGQRQMASMQAGFLERNSDGSDAARAEIQAWRDSEMATTAAGIESILGPDGMDVLDDYRDGRNDREFVESISRQASYSGETIDVQTTEQLVNVLRGVRETTPIAFNPYQRGEGGQMPVLTTQNVQQYLSDRKAQNQAILAEAGKILTPTQLEALADRQIEQLQREQSQLDFQLRNPDMNQGGRGWFGGDRRP